MLLSFSWGAPVEITRSVSVLMSRVSNEYCHEPKTGIARKNVNNIRVNIVCVYQNGQRLETYGPGFRNIYRLLLANINREKAQDTGALIRSHADCLDIFLLCFISLVVNNYLMEK